MRKQSLHFDSLSLIVPIASATAARHARIMPKADARDSITGIEANQTDCVIVRPCSKPTLHRSFSHSEAQSRSREPARSAYFSL
jgi:hypothetical protein